MILVTGGTGFIGRHLITALALQGQRVRALSRSPDKLFESPSEPIRTAVNVMERLASLGRIDEEALQSARERAQTGEMTLREAVEPVSADIRDEDALRRAMEGVEAVVHTVAVIRQTQGRTYDDTNVEATKSVVEAMKEAGVRRLLYMGILGATNNPALHYARSRWLAEQAVQSSGLDYTILKPSLVLGVPDMLSLRMLRLLDFLPPVVPLPNGGHTRFQPIWVGDMVAILLMCLQDQETTGNSYELGGPEYVTFGQMAREFAKITAKRRIFVPVPVSLLLPGAVIMGKLFKDPPATPTELRQLSLDNTAPLDSVQRYFGFEPRRFSEYAHYIEEIAHPQPLPQAR
jgi:NADH dehydrogenase